MKALAVLLLGLGVAAPQLDAQSLRRPTSGEPSLVRLKFASFDPATTELSIPMQLQGSTDTNLFLVQLGGAPTEAMRQQLRSAGAKIHSFIPDWAYVVRMSHGVGARVRELPAVRSVSYYHPAFRLEPFLRGENAAGKTPKRRYNIVVVDKQNDKPALATKIAAVGGVVDSIKEGSLLVEATLTVDQLLRVARLDEVLWIDRWSLPEDDMDNARIQGGANYIETAGGYTGQGIIGHQYEGLEASHRDWNKTPIGFPAGCANSSGHGHNTAGIVYGNGTSSPLARGMAPDAQAFFTSCRTNRYSNFQTLINTHNIMFTTASWGSARTRSYTSVSAEADDICFDLDLVWTNSQSNAGNQDSRAEAWAKNVFSCGGVAHRNNSNPNDDSWQAGGASIGPAADKRIKPDFCAYYDNIATSRTGGGFTTTFGGTSGATPIVAGHNALAIQMYTDGVFGNTLRKPGGTRFENKPKFTTLKALQMANAAQYPFTSTSTDNRREHQGWGFPNLRTMYDNRKVMFIVDEEDVIKQGEGMAYTLDVPAGRTELKISMSFADPAANPASQLARINDLTLRVTDPSGRKYWGNAGLEDGNYSVIGGNRDRINTTENVFVSSPAGGKWVVEVIAYSVVQDSHVETTVVDADFGLVVNGATFDSKKVVMVQVGSIAKIGTGCVGSGTLPSYCVQKSGNGGSLTRATRQWEYGYEATTASAISVEGFELFTASVGGGNITANASIYLVTNGLPTATPLATTTMTVGGAEAFYKATFAAPVAIPAGAVFAVSLVHANTTYVSALSGGASGRGFYRGTTGWTVSGLATAPSFRITCAGGAQKTAPVLGVSGTPEVGQMMTASVTFAAPSAPAILFTGNSDQMWGSVNLPFSLSVLGAASCNVYVSLDVVTPMSIDAQGNGSTSYTIPNSPVFIGTFGFQQCMVVDPAANQLGAAVTNGVKITVGG